MASITSEVRAALEGGRTADLLVHFPPIEVQVPENESKDERRQQFFEQKQQGTTVSQQATIQFLQSRGANFKAFWMTNTIAVFGATLAFAEELAAQPNVVSIGLNTDSAHILS